MNTDKTNWSLTIPGKMINSNEVHICRGFLDMTAFQRGKIFGNLSRDEVERAGRFYVQRDRDRFIAGRGMLRQILGYYSEEDPCKLQFQYTAKGKPSLINDSNCNTLRFNLSHSGPWALYAVTRGRDIGIDIEHIRCEIAIDEIAQKFFSAGEVNSLEMEQGNKRYKLFFHYWTRKEAFVKARGEGLSFPIEQVDVSLIKSKDLSPIILLDDKAGSARWYAQDLFPAHNYVAAIAAEGNNWKISCWQYSA